MAAKDEEDSCFSLGWLFTFIRIYFGETLSCQRCFQKMLCVDIKIMMYAIKILLLHTEDIHKGSERSEREADVMAVVAAQITVSSHLSCAGKSWRGTWQVWHEADIIIIIIPSLCFGPSCPVSCS